MRFVQCLLAGSGPTLGTSVKAVSTELGLGLGEDLAGGMTLRLLLPGALEGAGAGSSLPPEPAGWNAGLVLGTALVAPKAHGLVQGP